MRSFARSRNTASSFQTKFKDGCCFAVQTSPRNKINLFCRKPQNSKSCVFRKPCLSFWGKITNQQFPMTGDHLPTTVSNVEKHLLLTMMKPMKTQMSMRMDTMSMMNTMRLRPTMKAGPMTVLMRMLPTSKKMRQPLNLTSTLSPSTLIRMTRLLLHTWMLVEGSKTWSSAVDFCQLWHWLTRTLCLLPPVLHLLHVAVEKALESQKGNRKAKAVDPMLCDTHRVVNAKLQILEPELQLPHNACDAVLLDIKQLSALDLQSTVVPLRCQPALRRSRTLKVWPQPSCLMSMDLSSLRTNLDALASIALWWTQEQVPFWWVLAHSTVMWSISSSLDLPWRPLRCGALAGLSLWRGPFNSQSLGC